MSTARKLGPLIAVAVLLGLPWVAAQGTSNESEAWVEKRLPASDQRVGDPERGFDYLVSGDYLTSGIPLALYGITRGFDETNLLGRDGDNARLPYDYSAVQAANGQKVVTANCLVCHAQKLNGQLIVGLGNSVRDFTQSPAAGAEMIDRMIQALYGDDSPQREAFGTFRDVIRTVGPHIETDVVGTNPATKLAYLLAGHRDPHTLEWQDEPQLPLPPKSEVVPTAVPPLWHVRQKNALFYTGTGRGDFARLVMASSLLTLTNADEAAEIDEQFADVVAYLKTIEPPEYPGTIDRDLARRGAQIFSRRCASCHGTYGERPSYPNLLISLEEVGTDPLLAESSAETYRPQVEAYNASWFGQGPHAARLVPELGYVAPPLDGVWATAPYLHNGSVPTLDTLLDSPRRPRYWRRTFRTDDYDLDRVGWRYEAVDAGGDTSIYDTTLPGHSADGHTYADALTDEQRRALLEYLKTL